MKKIKQELAEVHTHVKRDIFTSRIIKIKLGLRTGKTILSVYISGLISILIGNSPLFAIIAAITCLQTKVTETVSNAVNQIAGALIGGAFSVLVVTAIEYSGIPLSEAKYYTILAFTLWPIVITTLAIGMPSITATSCVVFIAICLSPIDGVSSLTQISSRIGDTVTGILITVLIDLIIPNNKHTQNAS